MLIINNNYLIINIHSIVSSELICSELKCILMKQIYFIFTIFVYIFLRWIYKLFKTGRKRDLEVNDLYATLNDHASSSLGRELEE